MGGEGGFFHRARLFFGARSWDRATIEKGRNRKCRLVLVDGFDPAVFASEVLSACVCVCVASSRATPVHICWRDCWRDGV